MPQGTLRVYPLSENESVLYVRLDNDTESEAIVVSRNHPAIIRRLAEIAASVGFVRLMSGEMFAISGVQTIHA